MIMFNLFIFFYQICSRKESFLRTIKSFRLLLDQVIPTSHWLYENQLKYQELPRVF